MSPSGYTDFNKPLSPLCCYFTYTYNNSKNLPSIFRKFICLEILISGLSWIKMQIILFEMILILHSIQNYTNMTTIANASIYQHTIKKGRKQE